MPREIGDHPEIAMAMATGYPSWNQPEEHYCEGCGVSLDGEAEYEDETHDYLCEDCLKSLHKKWW